jgi:hypothetical protein
VSTFTEISGCFQPGQAKVGPRPTPLGCSLPESSRVLRRFSLRTCTTLTRQTRIKTQKTARHKIIKKLSVCICHQKYFYKVLCYTSTPCISYASKNKKNLNSLHLLSEIVLLRFFTLLLLTYLMHLKIKIEQLASVIRNTFTEILYLRFYFLLIFCI